MLAAAAALVLIWNAPADLLLPKRINESMAMASALLLLGVAFLVAWRAGDHPPNVSMALALAFAFSNGPLVVLLEELYVNAAIAEPVAVLTFILGAGFYIRAAQLFPRKLTPDDIAFSPTIWGRIKPLRVVLIFFLRARAVWVFVTGATLLTVFVRNPHFFEAIRLVIVLMGLVYFYVMYRSGDVEARRKVLWFFEAALASLVIGLIAEGVNAVLHGTGSPTLPVVLSVFMNAANYLAQVICISAAVSMPARSARHSSSARPSFTARRRRCSSSPMRPSKRFSLTSSSTWRALTIASRARSSARCSASHFIRLRTAWSMRCGVWALSRGARFDAGVVARKPAAAMTPDWRVRSMFFSEMISA
jgi:hypothetical protein